jgi:hypothetical protein
MGPHRELVGVAREGEETMLLAAVATSLLNGIVKGTHLDPLKRSATGPFYNSNQMHFFRCRGC